MPTEKFTNIYKVLKDRILSGEYPNGAYIPSEHMLIEEFSCSRNTGALPDGYRTVINLYAFEQKSHKEIASLLGITESTSASQLHRARAILAKEINEYKRKNGDAL